MQEDYGLNINHKRYTDCKELDVLLLSESDPKHPQTGQTNRGNRSIALADGSECGYIAGIDRFFHDVNHRCL